MIKIVLGASGSGKTTWIQKNIIKDRKGVDIFINGLKMHKIDELLLFGHYNLDRRCKGCDTLSMSAINNIIETLGDLLKNDEYLDFVLDGDRINNQKMLNFLLPIKEDVEIIFIDLDLETIYERNPECNKTFVKATKTKTKNMIEKYKKENFKVKCVEY